MSANAGHGSLPEENTVEICVGRASGNHRKGDIAALFSEAIKKVQPQLDAERRTETISESSQNLRLK
jgi:hypothetical protein